MTDLNSSLTDFDKSLITEAPKPPELKPFSVWSEENQLTEADPQSFVQYSDYIREGYLEQGAYTPSVEGEIRGSLNSKLADLGVADEESIQALTATKEPSFEEKFEYVRAGLNSDDEDWMTLTEYKAGEKVVAAGGTVQPYQDKVSGLKLKSEEVVNRRFDEVKRNLVESNQIPMAYVTNETGERELLVGDAAENMTVNQAIKASKIGGVSFKDGLAAQALLSPVAGLDVKLYKFKQIAEISEGIAELAQQDASVAEHVTGHTRQLARKDQNAFDSVGGTVTRGISDLLTFVGVESEESNAKKKRVYIASRQSFDDTIEYITEKLNGSGANYSPDDVRAAYEAHVVHEGARTGAFKLHQDPSEAGKNLYKTALGPVLNPAVFAREEDMVNTLAAHPELTAQQKKLFLDNRVQVLKQNFASYSKLLSESAVGDDWAKALVSGRQAGRDDLDIFDDFIEKDENFNEYLDSAKGIAYSVWDSVASLLYIAPAAMGADWAKDGLANAAQRQSDRREVAQIFGEQYGLFQDVSESVAPLIVDVAATAALASVSGGAAGAGYLAVRSVTKGGAQLTAKGLGKALTSNVLRASSKEGYEEVAEMAAKGLIKESLETGGRAKTIEAIEAFNKAASSKFSLVPATFVPAATRSGAMSYGSLYNQLRKDPNLTEEEAHDRALGFALTSGAITGVITSGFSAIGRGGVEDALLKGMTFRESKKLFQAMGNTGGITNETVKKTMTKVMNDSIKKYGSATLGKKIVKNVVDESFEEGVDQLVNSFVEDVALNQDTPMLERMKQVWHAAQVGGILGGGVPAIQAGARFVGVTPMDQREQRIRMMNDFAEQVSSELEGTGSPLAAAQVRELMMTRARGRGAAAPAPEPAPEIAESSTITEQALLRKENAKRSKEIAQEISKLDDESTLPENAEEREAEVTVREQRRIELEQESMALSQEEQNLRISEQSPTTPDVTLTDQQVDPEVFLQSLNESSPLDVEIAFENIRNQQNINFNNSEDTTVLKIEGIEDPSVPASETPFDYGRKSPRKIKDYAGGPSIDFTQEQTNAESVGVSLQGESRTNISSTNSDSRGFDPSKSKRYSSRPSSGTLRFDDPPFSGPKAEEKANKLIDFAVSHGFPLNLDPNVSYGLPMPSESSRQSLSEFVASAVYTAYPKLAPPKNAKLDTSKRPKKTYFDPVSGKTERQPVKFFVDDSGNGIFDNDPISIIEMLRAAKTVKVPRSFNRANLNPAIRIKDGRVTDVVGPTANGILLESKLGNARDVSSIEPNNARAAALASIPFKPATLPDGVADFDPKNGGPIEGEFFASTTDIKNRINRFALELEKTGDETTRPVQARFGTLSGERGLEFHAAALESAKQEFLFNAQLFSLREKVKAFGQGTNPTTPFDELVAQTGSKNVDQAAQKLLPFVKVESNINLTSETILGLFIEQKLQNNPDFANNATPTFDTLLRKATDRFKLQQDDANSLREQRAVSTLPFDVAPAEFRTAKVSGWIANFGRNPEGELASPQDISDAVSGAIDTAIGAVNTSPDLRIEVNKIILDEVLNDPTPEMKAMVENASAEDVFGLFTSWMSSGNGDTRPSVNKLVDAIEENAYSDSGTDFLNALLLVNFATRSDGASYENSEAVKAYQALFTDAVGTQISIDEAKNTMIALTKAVRTHLSRSNISAAERATITAENEADIERLGLESGNPDSVIKALKEVAKNSDNPSHKVVADLLLRDTDLIKGANFVLGETTADIAGKYIKGNDGSHTVFINVTSGNGRGLVNTLLEEYVHAFISDTTSSTDAQIAEKSSQVQTTLKQLSAVFDFAKESYESQKERSGPVPSLENALVDLNEFTAQFLLSEEVQKHVRDLKRDKVSIFDRFLINLAMLFPNVGRGAAKKVAESLEDVIDVGRNTRPTTTTNAKALGGQVSNRALFSSPVAQTESRIERAEALREMQRETDQARLEAKRQKDVEDAERFLEGVSEADRPKVRELYNYIRGLVPVGIDIKLTTESRGSAAFVDPDSSAIFINLPVMLSQTGDVSDIAGRAIAGVIINEELTHTASFNALTAEEIQNYIDSLSDSDYVDIAKEYLVGNEGGLATMLARLQSSDPQVVAGAKYQLAEEKLRMHLQKVTRGFTTEDDTQFWKSKPSLLRILNRYFRGIINRWVANRKKIGPAADVALNKLIIEMRAIEVGFVRQPTKMAFNPENPMEAFRMFGTVNQDFVGLAETPQTMDDGESYLTPDQLQNLNNVRSGKSQNAPTPIHSEFSPVAQAADNLANGFNLSNGTSVTLERGGNGSVLFMGGGRAFLVVNVNGSRVAFYQSTGAGGKKLQSGKWYPTTGLAPVGIWLNKTNSEGMATYYGSRALAEIASKLDNTLGNVDRFVLRIEGTTPIVEIKAQQGTDPLKERLNPDGRETFLDDDGRVFQAVKDLAAEFDSAAGMKSPQSGILYSAPVEDAENIWSYPEQLYDSAATSINEKKRPSGYNTLKEQGKIKSGELIVDIGGGRFDNLVEDAAEQGALVEVYDPFNRTPEHNARVVDAVKDGQADMAMSHNVLNVIKEDENIIDVIRQAKNAVKIGGEAHFSVYQGSKADRDRGARQTSKGWQRFQTTREYLPFVEAVFGKGNVSLKGSIITATKTPTSAEGSPQSGILYSAPVAGATTPAEIPPEIASASDPIVKHIYVKEDGKFYEKIKNGYIKIQQSLDQFEGMAVMLHQPDGAMAGTLEVEGDKVVDGKGGVYYPVMFGDQGYFWASTKDAAESMAKNLNKISKRNNGTILMALTSAPIEKMFSSTTMATGAVNLFATLAKNPKKYGITEAVVNRAIVNASKERLVVKKKDKDTGVETTTIKEFPRKLKLKDGLAKNIEEMKKNLHPEESVFPQRGSFIAQISSAIADSMELPTVEVQKKFSPKEKAAFDKKKNQALNIANLLAGDKNLYNKSLIPKGNLKMASVMQGMADLFAEPLVKTFQQFQQKSKTASGRVYAVLSIKGEVEAVETDFHDSYPYSIRSTSGETPVVHVLSESNLWKDVVYSAKKPNPKKAADPYDGNTDPIKKSEEDSIFPPSVGVSQRELIFRKADEGVETVKLPLYSAPTAAAAAAAPSGQPTGSNIDFSAVVDLLEIPVYELETGKPQNFIMKFLNKVFAGELPEAFRRLIQNRDAYKRLTEANVVAYKKKMDKLIKETYGGYENAPMEMIALAQGHYTGNMVTDEVLDAIEKDYDDAHADAERKRKAGEITDEQADSLKGLAHNRRTKATDRAYEDARKSREADRDAALRDLAKDSPELAAHIIDIRQELIIPLQKKLVDSGLDKNIGAKISKTGGIYITRSYRMFTDSSYLQKVREDPDYQDVRDAAMEFFNDQYIKNKAKELVEGGMDKSRAKVEARILLERENQSSPHGSYAQGSLNSFLMQYEKGGRDSTTATPKSYKMIEDNLRRRKELPEPIRNLLGEIGSESGIDLILRTYSTVATIASQQAFLNQMVAYGKETGVMITVEEKFATAESRAKYANFEPARAGAPSKNDPLSGMLVDRKFKEILDVALMDSLSMEYADTAEKAVKGAVGLAANLSGKAMAAKTLGSIGFYLRNGIGNLLFGTSQGFFRYDKMVSEMLKGTYDLRPFKDGEIDPEISELIGLNIKGDELRAGVLKDLLNGKVTPDGIRKQIEELGEKTKLNKVTKGLAMIEKKAQDLSAALDAAYKIVYYNHELAILMEAKAADTSTVKDGKVGVNNLAAMSDTQIKRLAARKVVMTSQAYSQAPPAVAAFTKSGLGLLFAPFIRFKMEVPRIMINTFKLASEEIASGNPVLVRRGRFRKYSMMVTIGVLSSALPMALAALSGIGDEEDEAMRASIPDYLRGHTFFYYRWNGELKSVDLTYVNPYSLLVDPFLRGYENIRRGEFTEAGAAIALGLVRDQYLDDQILAGAVSEARRNLNPSTGKPIWNKGADGPMEAGSKILGHIAKEAYAPRLGKDFFEGWSTGSLKGMTLEIMDGAMPFRIHDVDLQKQYSRYLLDLNNRFNNVKSGLNAVKRNTPMSDGDVADIIDENIDDRRLLNYELMRINKGFASLGLTNTDLLKGMKDKKLGRDRVALLSKGYMDRPSFKYIIESLLDPRTDEYGRARAQQVYDHASKINRYIPVRPITESE
tara:strand:+ start:932 stop:13306 length:12375 start_codon:yes stop_codon:yes gene_type:complete